MLRAITPHILIVGGDPSHGQATGVPVIADRMVGAGALSGLYTARVDAPTEQVLVIACDMPFLTAPFLFRLAVTGRQRTRTAAGALRVIGALGDLEVRHGNPDELALFHQDGRSLLHVNTPDDYQRALTLE